MAAKKLKILYTPELPIMENGWDKTYMSLVEKHQLELKLLIIGILKFPITILVLENLNLHQKLLDISLN